MPYPYSNVVTNVLQGVRGWPYGGGGDVTTPTAPTVPGAINPAPTSGQGPFGAVPGAVGLPDPYGDLSKVFPALSGANAAVGTNLLSGLGGQLAPGTLKMMQDLEAQQAVGGGMPGTNMRGGTLFGNRSVRDLGLTAEQVKNQAMQQYTSLIPTIKGTQTVSPGEQTALAQWNAINRAAPDPTQAASYAERLFNDYLLGMRGPGGSTRGYTSPAGGTGMMAPTTTASTGASSPSVFPFNTPDTGGGGLDPLLATFGYDPEAMASLGDWWNQAPSGATTGTASTPPDLTGAYADYGGELGF